MKPSASKKGPAAEKTREQVMAEREAKKQAKLAKKKGVETVKPAEPIENSADKPIVPEKSRDEILAERAAKKSEKKKGGKTENDENKPPEVSQRVENEGKTVQEGGEKSKAQLKAERRAKQEAQRAKKAEAAVKDVKPTIVEKKAEKSVVAKTSPKAKTIIVNESARRVKLFAHLYAQSPLNSKVLLGVEDVHPEIARLGAQYRTRVVCGSNVRCLALLIALKQVIEDFRVSSNEDLARGLTTELTSIMAFLNNCRPCSVSMTNAVKQLRAQITRSRGTDVNIKEGLIDWIETYIKEQLDKAAEAISISVRQKISDGDVILTYGYSSLIQKILTAAAKEGIGFRVIVVDGRPWLEGKELLRRLQLVGIPCTYILVNALSYVMPEVTKILLGAHALLANGYVMSRCGASQVALMGRSMNVPVLVCCETHKFSERVQTDSFVHNELGDPEELIADEDAVRLRNIPSLTSLSLMYDVTPPDLVSAVVTELAILPCTSVPVILRFK